MTRLLIQWEPLNGGEIAFAHFPEPFPMTDPEYEAFEAVFRSWERRQWQSYGEIQIDERSSPTALVAALQGLGYEIEHRGAIPPGILSE